MCLFNFVEAELDIDVNVQAEFAKLLFTLDFGSIGAGGFRALVDTPRFAVSLILQPFNRSLIYQDITRNFDTMCIQGIAADLGVEFGILLNRPSFFSIDSLINILIVVEAEGIDINGADFMVDLDTLVTGTWIMI